MVLPALILFGLFALLPMVMVVVLSFTRWDGLTSPAWAGLANWTHLLTSSVTRHAMWLSLQVVVLSWVIQTPVSLLLGENFVGRQAWDLTRVIDALGVADAFPGKPVGLYARGQDSSLLATYAIARDAAEGLRQAGLPVVRGARAAIAVGTISQLWQAGRSLGDGLESEPGRSLARELMRRAAKRVLEGMSAIYKIVREAFDGIRAVKGFTREARERRRLPAGQAGARPAGRKHRVRAGRGVPGAARRAPGPAACDPRDHRVPTGHRHAGRVRRDHRHRPLRRP